MISIQGASSFLPSSSISSVLVIVQSFAPPTTILEVGEASATSLVFTVADGAQVVDSIVAEVSSAVGSFFTVTAVGSTITVTEAA